MTTREIKTLAKEKLNNHWGLAIGSCMMEMLLMGIASLQSVGQLIVYGPLKVGACSVFSGIVREEDDVCFNRLFRGFARRFGVNLLVGLLYNLFIALWTLLFIVPGIVMSYAYAMTMFIQNDNPTMKGKQALDASRAMMYGHKWELFVLNLSFLGWDLLTVLTCGTLSIYVTPYKTTALAVFYENLLQAQSDMATKEAEAPIKTSDDAE